MSSFGVKLGTGTKTVTARKRRHVRVRKKVSGTPARPRLVVTRSARHVVAQVIDDTQGVTLASASTMEADLRGHRPTRVPRHARSDSWSQSVRRRPALTPSSSTAAATSTTVVLLLSLRAPAKLV